MAILKGHLNQINQTEEEGHSANVEWTSIVECASSPTKLSICTRAHWQPLILSNVIVIMKKWLCSVAEILWCTWSSFIRSKPMFVALFAYREYTGKCAISIQPNWSLRNKSAPGNQWNVLSFSPIIWKGWEELCKLKMLRKGLVNWQYECQVPECNMPKQSLKTSFFGERGCQWRNVLFKRCTLGSLEITLKHMPQNRHSRNLEQQNVMSWYCSQLASQVQGQIRMCGSMLLLLWNLRLKFG